MKTLSLLFTFICMLFVSCDLFSEKEEIYKKQNKLIRGKIIDNSNFNAISNLCVYLYKADHATGFYKIDSTLSNNLGEFSFTFDYTDASSYKLTLYSNDFYTDSKHLVVEAQTDTIEIKLQPLAYINFKIKNIPPSSNTDEFNFSLQSNYFDNWRIKGGQIDTSILVRVPSLIPIKFTFRDKGINKDNIFSKEYQLDSAEVVNELIEY